MKWVVYLIALLIGTVSLVVGATQAATVSPATVDLIANRGESINQEMIIHNSSDQTRIYSLSTIKFESSEEPGVPKFIPYEEDHTGLAEWIKFPERTVEVDPGQTATLALTIAVPSDIEAGGYYAAVLVSEAGEAGNVSVEAKIAVLFFLTVEGENSYKAEILEFETKGWTNRLPVDFSFRMQNQGNVHLIPIGQIVVRDFFGTPVAGIPVNEELSRVLPMSTREFTASWIRNEVTKSGFFEEMNNEWINFGLGRYKATLELKLDNGETVQADSVFWIFPWQLALLAFVILNILIAVTVLRKKLALRIEEQNNQYDY